METTKQETDENLSFMLESIKSFHNFIEAMNASLPALIKVMYDNSKDIAKELSSFLEENSLSSKEVTSDDGTTTIAHELHHSDVKYVTSMYDKIMNNTLITSLIPKSIFISLISQFDIFISNVIRFIMRKQPNIIINSNKQISMNELVNFISIDDVKEYIIDREIDAKLRENHTEHINWIEKTLGIDTIQKNKIFNQFIEITERRNLFVHTDGVVSKQYINNCNINNVNIGDKISIDAEYFNNSCMVLYEIAMLITQSVLRKLYNKNTHEAERLLIESSYRLLQKEKYAFVKCILENYIKLAKYQSSENMLLININYLIASKYLGLDITEYLKAFDISALSYRFQLAYHILSDDIDNSCKIMKAIGNQGEVMLEQYVSWPLFKNFSKTQEFLDTYKEIFQEDFLKNKDVTGMIDTEITSIPDTEQQEPSEE